MRQHKTLIILGSILLVAFFLRTYKLDNLELFGDEVDVGYQAYSLLKTGRDYRGNFLPVYSDSLSEARAPLFLYSAIPFVGMFGLNEWGVRATAIFWGILDIVFFYLLIDLLFKNRKIALMSAFLLSVTPWHLHYSRAAFEVTLLLFLLLLGAYALLKAIEGRKYYLFLAAIAFSFSFYTYNTANIFVPLLIISLIVIFRKAIVGKFIRDNQKSIILSAILALIIIFPLCIKIFSGSALGRFNLISIFSDQKLRYEVVVKRNTGIDSFVEIVFHNKVLSWLKEFLNNYLESFSFRFLFVSGDPNPRHTVPGFGLIFYTFIPFLLYGIFLGLKTNDQKSKYIFFLFWLLISPIASSLTSQGGSHATRLFLMLPPLAFFSGVGVINLAEKSKGKIFVIFLGLVFVFEFLSYYHELFVHYAKEQYRYWHFGYKQAVILMINNQEACPQFYVNNTHDPFLIRYLFWGKVEPSWFQKQFTGDKENLMIKDLFSYFSIGKVNFGRVLGTNKLESIERLTRATKGCYLGFQQDDVPGDWNLQESPVQGLAVLGLINDPWGKPYIYLLKSTAL